MGQMADAILDGECCAICGQQFEDEPGFPCACSGCWTPDCGYAEHNNE